MNEEQEKLVTIQHIKEKRLVIDELMQELDKLPKDNSIIQASNKLREAKAWFGEMLKLIGTPNPYPESKNPNSGVIEVRTELSTVDNNRGFATMFADLTDDVAKIKAARLILDGIIDEVEGLSNTIFDFVNYFDDDVVDTTQIYDYYKMNSLINSVIPERLTESKHWLGWALNDIRESKTK